MELLLVIALVLAAVFAAIGVAIAKNKGVSTTAGFWLGALLGPIGLIVIALLNPTADAPAQSSPRDRFSGPRELSHDGYKLWLASNYNIQKSDVLGAYVCGERLFPSIEAALAHANDLDEQRLATLAAADQRAIEQFEAERQAKEEEQRRARPFLIAGAVVTSLLLIYLFVAKPYLHQREVAKHQQELAKREQEAARSQEEAKRKALAAYEEVASRIAGEVVRKLKSDRTIVRLGDIKQGQCSHEYDSSIVRGNLSPAVQTLFQIKDFEYLSEAEPRIVSALKSAGFRDEIVLQDNGSFDQNNFRSGYLHHDEHQVSAYFNIFQNMYYSPGAPPNPNMVLLCIGPRLQS